MMKWDARADLPTGWACAVVPRKNQPMKSDVYYFAPDGTKLRSGKDIERWIKAQPADSQYQVENVRRHLEKKTFSFSFGVVTHVPSGSCYYKGCDRYFRHGEALKKHLLECDKLVERDISGGREKTPITCVNETGDGEKLPPLQYTSTLLVASEQKGGQVPLKVRASPTAHACQCKSSCSAAVSASRPSASDKGEKEDADLQAAIAQSLAQHSVKAARQRQPASESESESESDDDDDDDDSQSEAAAGADAGAPMLQFEVGQPVSAVWRGKWLSAKFAGLNLDPDEGDEDAQFFVKTGGQACL